MHLETPDAGPISGYLRTLDFEGGEVRARWKDGRGEWLPEAFVSRPDNVVAQLLTARRAMGSTRHCDRGSSGVPGLLGRTGGV